MFEVNGMVVESEPRKLDAWLKRLHVGMAHASPTEMTQLLKNSGGPLTSSIMMGQTL